MIIFTVQENFKKPAMKVNKDVLIAYERLKQNDLFSTVKKTLFQMILPQ